jgi:Tol biopolymer transport system component
MRASYADRQLRKILASREFIRADRMARFLTYVVQCRLEGRSEDLKERAIGVAVFDRESDWDPKLDNIVRSEARRLRTKLRQYYESSTGDEFVLIDIPTGAYSPEFKLLRPPEPESAADATPAGAAAPLHSPQTLSLPKPEPDPAPVNFLPRHAWWLAVATIAGAVVFLRVDHGSEASATGHWEPAKPFANEIGTETQPAISPDGNRIAYAWDPKGDNYDIYVKPSEGGPSVAPQRITSSQYADLYPAWSPDGRKLAFLRILEREALIVVNDLPTGSEQVVHQLRRRSTGWADENQPYMDVGPSWLPDGKSLVVSDAAPGEAGYGIYRVSLDRSAPTLILKSEREVTDFFPRVSPDGTKIAFARYISHGVSDLYVCEIDGQQLRKITFDGRSIQGLSWAANGKALYYSGWRQGRQIIWKVAAARGSVPEALADSGGAAALSIGPQTGMLAHTVVAENWNIWRISLAEPKATPSRFIASSGRNHGPSFSPDGKLLAFISDRDGDWRIWLASADGANQRAVSQFDGNFLGSITWSPDSKWIAFDGRPKGNANIFRMDVTRGGVPEAVETNHFEERMPYWSADGKYLFYNSNRDGAVAVWKRSLVDGRMTKVGPNGSFKSMVDSTQPGIERLLFNILRGPVYEGGIDATRYYRPVGAHAEPEINWTLHGAAIYFTREEAGRKGSFYELRDGKKRLVGQSEGDLVGNTSNLAVSTDGKWLLYAQRDHTTSDIVVRRAVGHE